MAQSHSKKMESGCRERMGWAQELRESAATFGRVWTTRDLGLASLFMK